MNILTYTTFTVLDTVNTLLHTTCTVLDTVITLINSAITDLDTVIPLIITAITVVDTVIPLLKKAITVLDSVNNVTLINTSNTVLTLLYRSSKPVLKIRFEGYRFWVKAVPLGGLTCCEPYELAAGFSHTHML